MAGERTRVVVSMPADVVEALDRLGRERGCHRNSLIRESVERFLQDHDRELLRARLIEGYQAWSTVYEALGDDEWSPNALPRE
jgi:metal-responsive CopG/Arc/MetJ family transcriptional regulator